MGVHYTILQTSAFDSWKFSVIQRHENTRPHSQRHTFPSLGPGASPVCLWGSLVFYCTAKAEQAAIAHTGPADRLHQDQGKGYGGDGTGLGEVKEASTQSGMEWGQG